MLPKRTKLTVLPGDTLIEVVVVAFILVVSLVALTSLTTVSIARNRLAKERVVATRLAQEGIDWMVAQRNRFGFESIAAIAGQQYCLNTFPTENMTQLVIISENCKNDLNGQYKRSITLTLNGEVTDVVSTVSWRETQVTLTGQLSKWEK